MSSRIPDRLLPDRVTIRKPVHSNVGSGTKRPTFRHDTIVTAVPARFDPISVALNRLVVGHTPKKVFRLFLNVPQAGTFDLKENYHVVREADDKTFIVTEVLDLFGHHLEATLEEKK